jgi:hypothetical protein
MSAADEQRLKCLLAKQAELQAEIASLHSSSAPTSTPTSQPHRSPIHKQHQQRRRDVPRGMSNYGTTMAQQLSGVWFPFGLASSFRSNTI